MYSIKKRVMRKEEKKDHKKSIDGKEYALLCTQRTYILTVLNTPKVRSVTPRCHGDLSDGNDPVISTTT